MKPPKDLDEFRERLIEFSGKLIEAVQDADDPKMATFYMIQAKSCMKAAKDDKILRAWFKLTNDGEHILADTSGNHK